MTCPADHKHSETGTCYVIHKCRCDDCREGRKRYARDLRRRHLYGTFDNGLTEVEPVRAHIEFLRSKGMGWKFIAERAGVGYTAVEQIIYGRTGAKSDPRRGERLKRVSRVTAEKILAVRPVLRRGALVPAVGTQRRLQALAWLGYPLSWVAREIGVAPSNLLKVFDRDRVRADTWEKVKRVFDAWSLTPAVGSCAVSRGVVSRTRRVAREKGWASPFAWDDIDDPRERAKSGRAPRRRVDREAVEWMAREGLSDPVIAERLGVSDRSVLRVRQELGLESRWVA